MRCARSPVAPNSRNVADGSVKGCPFPLEGIFRSARNGPIAVRFRYASRLSAHDAPCNRLTSLSCVRLIFVWTLAPDFAIWRGQAMHAGVVKLVDAPDSKSGSERSVGSIPTARTIFFGSWHPAAGPMQVAFVMAD